MFRSASELRKLVGRVAPRPVTVGVDCDLPSSFEVSIESEEPASAFPFFQTHGSLHETPSGFDSSGKALIERKRKPERHELRLVDEPLALEGSHSVPVNSDLAALVETSDAVRASLAALLGNFSETVGADVNVELRRHSSQRFERADETVVESEYLARLDGLGKSAPSGGAPSVEEASVGVSRGDATDADWNLDVSGHDGIFADALGDRRYGKTDHVLAARRRSGFAQDIVWEVENGRDGVSAEVSYDSENAARYAEELTERGVETPARTNASFEYEGGATTSLSLDFETDGDPTESVRDRLGSWVGFVPLPVAPFVSYIS